MELARASYIPVLSRLVGEESSVKMRVENVLFDFGDTLVRASPRYSLDTCLSGLVKSLACSGVVVSFEGFKRAYEATYERIIADNPLHEVPFSVVVSRGLGLCGVSLKPADGAVVEATEEFMECWVQARTMERSVPSVLRTLRKRYRLGVVSNLAYSPAVSRTLTRFGVAELFDVIVVSADDFWQTIGDKNFFYS